jgi:putative hydrolase of the HAD superfamily
VVERTFEEPLPNEVAWACYDAFAEADAWRILPGVHEALTMIKQCGMAMVLVSNFDSRLPTLLDTLQLGPFAVVSVSAQCGRAKPDPAALMFACRELACMPGRVLHIGDKPSEDGAMAAALGATWLPCDAKAGIPLPQLTQMLTA